MFFIIKNIRNGKYRIIFRKTGAGGGTRRPSAGLSPRRDSGTGRDRRRHTYAAAYLYPPAAERSPGFDADHCPGQRARTGDPGDPRGGHQQALLIRPRAFAGAGRRELRGEAR